MATVAVATQELVARVAAALDRPPVGLVARVAAAATIARME